MAIEKVFIISTLDTVCLINENEYLIFPFKGAYRGSLIKSVYLENGAGKDLLRNKEYMLLCEVTGVWKNRLYGRILSYQALESIGCM